MLKRFHELSRKTASCPDGGADAERLEKKPTRADVADYAAHYECAAADVVYSTWQEDAPKKRGPKPRGAAKRVLISATVSPETAAKLRELAVQAGNLGRALDRLILPEKIEPSR